MKLVNTISVIALIYILIVVQVEIGFFWMEPPCRFIPTHFFDMAVDAWFMLEMLLTFVTGVYDAGVYRVSSRFVSKIQAGPIVRRGVTMSYLQDGFIWVTRRYLRGQFWFDATTCFPVSIIEHFVMQANCTNAGELVEGGFDLGPT